MSMLLKAKSIWNMVYEDETAEQKAAREAEEVRKKKEAENGNKTFTQDQVNSLLAEEKRKYKANADKAIADLEALKKQKGLTDEAKKALEQQIEDTRNQLLTKEEMAEKEKKRLEQDYKTKLEEESKQKEHWRVQYETATIKRAIQDAAITHEAFRPEQIVKLLNSDTHLVEEEKDGTRTYTPKVKFEGKDKDGKMITLDLPVDEAVKRMKEEPQIFGNLFKSTLAGGLGGSGGNNRGSEGPDPSKMTMDQYKKYRDEKLGRVKK